MRRSAADHLAQPWRVHAHARDFELLDVWRYPIEVPDDVSLETIEAFLAKTQRELLSGRSPAALLFALRSKLGALFGWDDPESASRHEGEIGFEPVYATPEEQLSQIENATVHALLHLGRVPSTKSDGRCWSPQMAVYIRPRGLLGRIYMAAITPFRRWLVYPAMLRAAARAWPDELRRLRSEASEPRSTRRLERVLAEIDAANRADPNIIRFAGERGPKELIHAERATHWLDVLSPDADELLRIAIRAHHVRRWQWPRAEFSTGRAGYHAWRRALQRRHAAEAKVWMAQAGYSSEEQARVETLICKRGLGRDPDVQVFEDALCLVFLEIQLDSFAEDHAPEKVVDILLRTLPKMSEKARTLAMELPTSDASRPLIERAGRRFAARSATAS